MKKARSIWSALCITVLMFVLAPSANAIPIDTKLALVIDVSGSADAIDYALQMSGYEAAFNNAIVKANIDALASGLAVEVFFFSSSAVSASVETLLTSASDSATFATIIGGITRPGGIGNSTDPADGMNLASTWLTDTTNWSSSNLIMDVSADGSGTPSSDQAARDSAAASGIVVNGLAIDDRTFFNDECNATGYFTLNIITSGAACFQAASFNDFERAVLAKIKAETGGPGTPPTVPVPGTLLLLGLGLAGLGFSARKKA